MQQCIGTCSAFRSFVSQIDFVFSQKISPIFQVIGFGEPLLPAKVIFCEDKLLYFFLSKCVFNLFFRFSFHNCTCRAIFILFLPTFRICILHTSIFQLFSRYYSFFFQELKKGTCFAYPYFIQKIKTVIFQFFLFFYKEVQNITCFIN